MEQHHTPTPPHEHKPSPEADEQTRRALGATATMDCCPRCGHQLDLPAANLNRGQRGMKRMPDGTLRPMTASEIENANREQADNDFLRIMEIARKHKITPREAAYILAERYSREARKDAGDSAGEAIGSALSFQFSGKKYYANTIGELIQLANDVMNRIDLAATLDGVGKIESVDGD